MNRTLPIIVLGAGGHASVLIDAMLLNGRSIIGIVDNDESKFGNTVLGVPVFGNDEAVLEYGIEQIQLVNGLGSVNSTKLREKVWRKFKEQGYQFASVRHPSAIVAPNACLDEGTQIMAGVVIQTGSHIGANSIINTKASVDHDCQIGANVHIAPGVTLSGGVRVGDNVHIGTGAIVIQGIEIGQGSMIAAGAVTIENVPPGVTIMGVPGKMVK
jgi:UDP-perosamine 4-acetyltransferase